MFQFRRFPSYAYLIQRTILEYCSSGFPHSEISGSTDICSSPKLIAACHVLRRLLMPRHSPCALYSLTLRDILVLFLELCRQSTGYFRKIVIVTHIFSDVPQLKFTTLFNFRWNLLLPCFHHISIHCSVFKVQLPASFEARSQNPIPWVLRSNAKLESWWARVGSNHRPYDYQSYALASWATGPFWWR